MYQRTAAGVVTIHPLKSHLEVGKSEIERERKGVKIVLNISMRMMSFYAVSFRTINLAFKNVFRTIYYSLNGVIIEPVSEW